MNTTVKNLFITVCEVYNLQTTAETIVSNPTQSTYYSNDFVKMDYNPTYGGYRINVVMQSTAQKDFNGNGRMTAKEMICFLKGMLAARSAYCFEGIVKA